MNDTVVCPQCRQSDKIERASTIVKNQRVTRERTEWVRTTYQDKQGQEQSYSYPRSYDIVEITDLAKQLSPPEKPDTRLYPSGCVYSGGLILFSLCILAGFIALWFVATDNSNDPVLYLFPAVPIGVGALGFIMYFVRYRNSVAKDRTALRHVNSVEIPRWDAAMYK